MSHRVVEELSWAGAAPRPRFARESRSRGAKAKGRSFERSVAKALPGAIHGQWFEFRDRNGPGWCQPDLFLELNWGILVLEAKYTWVPEGFTQMERLYKPVLEKIFCKPVQGVQICKVLTPEARAFPIVSEFSEAAILAARGCRVTLHYLGVGPLWPLPRNGHWGKVVSESLGL